MGIKNEIEQQTATEAAILGRIDQLEAKLDGIAAQLEGVLDVRLVLSQVAELVRTLGASARGHGQALTDLADLTSREARATRTMIRLAPTSPALAVAEVEADREN